MSLIKRIAILACIAAFAALGFVGLSGCGDTAATWEHGKVTEEEVTAAAQQDLSQFMNSDGVTYDVNAWTAYITGRSYDTNAAALASGVDPETGEVVVADSEQPGTLEEYRAFLINNIVRQQVIDYEVEKADIEVTDDEVKARVDEYATMYETYYGGGHAGTFESILEMYMGTDLDTFTENVRKSMLQEKYEMQVCGVESADQIDSEKFEAYVDSLMAYADIKIKDMPDELPYDPWVLEANQAGMVTDAAATEGAEGTEGTEGSDGSEQPADATATDDAATPEGEGQTEESSGGSTQ